MIKQLSLSTNSLSRRSTARGQDTHVQTYIIKNKESARACYARGWEPAARSPKWRAASGLAPWCCRFPLGRSEARQTRDCWKWAEAKGFGLA